ncbi:hypothetical protein Tco_0503437, partial [Tanacetum coccineum]
FNNRVTNLEKDMSEIKQDNQYAQALSSIHAIVDQLLEAVVLTRSSSQPKSTYEAVASLSEFELTNILLDKMEESKSHLGADYKKKLYDALVESYNTDKDLFNTYGEVFTLKRSRDDNLRSKEKKSSSTSKETSQSQHKHSGKSAHAEEPSHIVDDSGVQQDQEFDTGNNDEQIADKEVTKNDCKHLPLIRDHRGRQVIPQDFFINNELEYLKGGDLSRQYSTSVTKTKAATYEIKWIEDLVRNLWSPVKVIYDQYAFWGTSYCGPKRQHFYRFAANRTSSKDSYSMKIIIAVTRLSIMKKYDYSHLEEIEVHREDQKLYKFKEGDFP